MTNPNDHSALAHHTANAAAILIPVGSIVVHLPEIVSVLLGLVGLGWYGVLFYDRFHGNKHND